MKKLNELRSYDDKIFEELKKTEEGWVTLRLKGSEAAGKFYCLLAGIPYSDQWYKNIIDDLPRVSFTTYYTPSCNYQHRLESYYVQVGNLDVLYHVNDWKGAGWFSIDECENRQSGDFFKCSLQTLKRLPTEFRQYLSQEDSSEIVNIVGSEYAGVYPTFPTFNNLAQSEKLIKERDLLISKLTEIKQDFSDAQEINEELERNLTGEKELNETSLENLKEKFPRVVDRINKDELSKISIDLSKELTKKTTEIRKLEGKLNSYYQIILENEIISNNQLSSLDKKIKALKKELDKTDNELKETKDNLNREISYHRFTIGFNAIRRRIFPDKVNNVADVAYGASFFNRVTNSSIIWLIIFSLFFYFFWKIIWNFIRKVFSIIRDYLNF